jgi:hypothetical protein
MLEKYAREGYQNDTREECQGSMVEKDTNEEK